jgi:predicted transcriptional regulator
MFQAKSQELIARSASVGAVRLDIPSPCITMILMNIEIRDTALQHRIRKQLEATGSASVEEVLVRLLETQEEQDRWLQENRGAINAKIQRGLAELDRGEGVPEDRLDAHLKELKAKPE